MATAPENHNLLELPELGEAFGSSQLYVVHNGTDYRTSVETLLSLITLRSLGLDKVDNTSDMEKPISTATLEALNQKANISDIVGREELDGIIQQLQTMVTQEQLNTAISSITTALNSKLNQEQVELLIMHALAPITQGLTTIASSLEETIRRVGALEARDSVTQAQLTAAIQDVEQDTDLKIQALSSQVNGSIANLSQSTDLRLQNLVLMVNNINLALEGKAPLDHQHYFTDIVNFEGEVRRITGEYIGAIGLGEEQW